MTNFPFWLLKIVARAHRLGPVFFRGLEKKRQKDIGVFAPGNAAHRGSIAARFRSDYPKTARLL